MKNNLKFKIFIIFIYKKDFVPPSNTLVCCKPSGKFDTETICEFIDMLEIKLIKREKNFDSKI